MRTLVPDARLYDLPPLMSAGHADGASANSAGFIKEAVTATTEKVTG